MDQSEASKRVTLGSTRLDAARPGWASEVNLRTLNMESVRFCVLGQLYGDYRAGCDVLFPPLSRGGWLDPFPRSVEHGFTLSLSEAARAEGYGALHDAWRSAIKDRVVAARQ